MPRSISIDPPVTAPGQASAASPVTTRNIDLAHGEELDISITGNPGEVEFVVAASPGGTAVVRINGTNGVSITRDHYMNALTEAGQYFYEIWSGVTTTGQTRIIKGSFLLEYSILPAGLTYDTQVLEGGDTFGGPMTQAEYDAIASPVTGTLYIVQG